MSRDIRFRGQAITGEWVYGSVLLDKLRKRAFMVEAEFYLAEGTIVSIGRYEVLPETVGQFTGLYDFCKAEIYEDDIVQGDVSQVIGDDVTVRGVVTWNDDGLWMVDLPHLGQSIGIQALTDIVKLGDSYANPELISNPPSNSMREENWISVKERLPMITAEEYLQGGKEVFVTDGVEIWTSIVGDHNTWIHLNPRVTNWKPISSELSIKETVTT